MNLDISPLAGALDSLEKAIQRSLKEPQDDMIRDSVIQRFEYSYELCWKMLKRQLEQDVATPASLDAMSFKELIREGAERSYIQNPEHWFVYRSQRNITSYTYNAEKAESVHKTAIHFLPDARNLFEALQQKNQA